MGRIFTVQAKDVDKFRRKKKRRLKKGDIVRVGKGPTSSTIRRVLDLRPQNEDILDTRKYANRLNTEGTIFSVLEVGYGPGSGEKPGILNGSIQDSFSPEAEAVFNRMPNSLTDVEKECMADFIDEEVLVGNWQDYDVFYHFGLYNEQNALTSWIGVVNTATLNGGAAHQPGIGLIFDGINGFVDSGFTPSTGTKYQLNDNRIGIEIIDSDTTGTLVVYTGANDGTTNTKSGIQKETTGLISLYSNGGLFNTTHVSVSHELITSARKAATTFKLFVKGVEIETSNVGTTTLLNMPLYIGANNNNSVAEDFANITTSSFQAGSAVDFNYSQHSVHLTLLNDCLTDGAVIEGFPNPLEPFEEVAINNFLLRESIVGNTKKYDEFFCFALTDPANALHGWRQISTAINTNATHIPGIGFDFNGIDAFLDTNFNPAIAERYSQDDAIAGVFIVENLSASNAFNRIFGVSDGSNLIQLTDDNVGGSTFVLNDSTSSATKKLNKFEIAILHRDNAFNRSIYINGQREDNPNVDSAGIPDFNIYIGVNNISGSPGTTFFEGSLFSFIVGNGAGFNHFQHNINMIGLLNDLNVFDNQVIARYTGLTALEETSIRKFVKAEVNNGNWFLIEEVFCFSLAGANALIGMKAKTAINNGATFDLKGANFDGSAGQFIGTQVAPSDMAQNDVYFTLFTTIVNDSNSQPVGQILLNSFAIAAISDITMSARVNSGSAANFNSTALAANQLIGGHRDNPNNHQYYLNGIQNASRNVASVAPSADEIVVGSNLLGNFNGAAASFMTSASIGLDKVANYNNQLQLLIDLDIFAKPVIDSFPNPLTTEEETFVRDFINSQVLNGNWNKMDSFVHFGLSDPVNALWDWKRKTGMTNNGTVHSPGIGYVLDGLSQYIDSNYNPTNDAVNYALNDALFGVFVVVKDNRAGNPTAIGARGSAADSQSLILKITTVSVRANSQAQATGSQDFEDETLYIGTDEGTNFLYKNGLQDASQATSGIIPDANFFIGAQSNQNAASLFYQGTISSFMAGGAIGFDNAQFYSELVILNNALRIESLIDSYPSPLLAAEKTALRNYFIAERATDNFFKLDSLVFFNLIDPINALWDVVREVTLTAIDVPIHTPGIGYITDGITQYITGFNPFVDGNNYQLDDALLGVFIADVGNLNDGSGHTPVGGGDVDSRADFFINTVGLAKQSFRINTIQPNGTNYDIPLVNNQLLMSARTSNTESSLYNDGVAIQPIDVISNTVPNANIDIGRLNNDGVGINYTQATYSLFIAGAGIGYNHSAGYLNLVTLNTEIKNITLDTDAQAIFDRMSTVLSQPEKIAINNFVEAEKAAGNWASYDEIQCYSLNDNQNKLTGWLGVGNASMQTGTVFGAKEIITDDNLNSYIDTGLDWLGLTNFAVANNHATIFTEEITRSGAAQILNLNPDGPTYDIYIFGDTDTLNNRSFSSSFSQGVVVNPLPWSTLTSLRIDANNVALHVDGIPFNNNTSPVDTPTSDGRIYLGLRITSMSQPYNGRYKFFSVGSALNNVVAHNTNVRQLILDLE